MAEILAMTCRLYIDEVGNDDTVSATERYLSLTGITTKTHGHETKIHPEIETIQNQFFGHNPPQYPVILHRREILRKEKPFDCLQNPQTNIEWETRILGLIETLPYIANTVLIDKQEHSKRYGQWQYNPYHYCMLALVERYVLWLNRHKLTGDVLAESRDKPQDKALKSAFRYLYENGTPNIPVGIMQRCLTSREIKFERKEANICALQLVDMIANPSHQLLKCQLRGETMKAPFTIRVVDALRRHRYARDPKTKKIEGWGLKTLP
jgi:hypothetical protein